jgi:hypothetical protein
VTNEAEKKPEIDPEHLRIVRIGHGANCSSVGSVIDTLFASAVIGGAIFAAIAAALGTEKITVVGEKPPPEKTDGTDIDEAKVP